MRWIKKLRGLVAVALIASLSQEGFPCSALLMAKDGRAIFGRNLDWTVGHGYAVVNQRGLRKKALVPPPDRPAEWTATYGSVTFNQVARELPYGGVNEKGLDVEQLWLSSARYPRPDARPAVNELQWIQYQLDNFSTVAQVIKHLDTVRIVKRIATVHYIVCDAAGACAVVEPIGGKLVIHRGKTLPVKALTNDQYADSVAYAGDAAGTGSLARFARLASALKKDEEPSIGAAFSRLDSVASPTTTEDDSMTRWSIVADLGGRVVHFKTPSSPLDKWIDLSRVDFSCGGTPKGLPIDVAAGGDLSTRLVDFTPEINLDLVEKSLGTGFAKMPPEAVKLAAERSYTETCAVR